MALQERLQQGGIEAAQFLAQPELTGQRVLDIKAIGRVRIKDQSKAQFDDQERMPQQKAAQLGGVEQAFANAQQEGFEVGAFRVGRPSTRGPLRLPVVDHRPIEQREEGAIIGNQGIMLKQRGDGGLVKEIRRRYHGKRLLL